MAASKAPMKRRAWYIPVAFLAVAQLLLAVGLPRGLVLCIAGDHVAVEMPHQVALSCKGCCPGAHRAVATFAASADRCMDVALSVAAHDTVLERFKDAPPGPALAVALFASAPRSPVSPRANLRMRHSSLAEPAQRALRVVRLLV